LGEIHAALARFWPSAAAEGAEPAAEWRAAFETAVMEVAGNVLRHAYPPGHKPGNVKLQLRLYDDRVEALLTDRGIPFEEPPALAADLADLDVLDLPEGGYGLSIARAALDRLEYSRLARGANRWRLVKRLAEVTQRS
jgi:anti-sigma regulatory factor (Ser/Thr protein kinase)